MNRILVETVVFGKQYLRTKVGAFFLFIFPVLLIALFGAVFAQNTTSTFELRVQDLDDTLMSRGFLAALNNTTVVHVTAIPASEDIGEYIRANSLGVALRVPAGFQADVAASLAGTGPPFVNLTIYGDPSRSTYGVVVGVVSAVAEQFNFQLAQARPIVGFDVENVASSQYQAIDFILPGIIGMTVMFNAMYTMTAMCAEYRTRKYFKLLATTTLKKHEWLLSRVLWFSMALLLSLLVSIAVGKVLWNVNIPLNGITALSVVFIVVGVLLFAGLGMLLGAFSKDPESASAIANVIGFPMMFLGGSFWQLEMMPSYLQAVAYAMPLTYLNNGLRDALVYQNLGGIAFNLAVVSALAIVFFVLGSRLMRWTQK